MRPSTTKKVELREAANHAMIIINDEDTRSQMTGQCDFKIKDSQVFFTICAELGRRLSRGRRQILSTE